MFEYDRVWDDSDDLVAINELSKEGWRVIAAFADASRGTMFILERVELRFVAQPEIFGVRAAIDAHDGAPA
jgi:hypothetical protein